MMKDRVIPPKYRRASASDLIQALADSLSAIKAEDGLTDAELGAFLGKGVDAGADYRRGFGEMPVTSFLRGCEVWNGRFANSAMAMIGMRMSPLDVKDIPDRASFTAVCGLLHDMSAALEDDDVIDEQELFEMRASVERAGQAIDRLRDRIKLRSVA